MYTFPRNCGGRHPTFASKCSKRREIKAKIQEIKLQGVEYIRRAIGKEDLKPWTLVRGTKRQKTSRRPVGSVAKAKVIPREENQPLIFFGPRGTPGPASTLPTRASFGVPGVQEEFWDQEGMEY